MGTLFSRTTSMQYVAQASWTPLTDGSWIWTAKAALQMTIGRKYRGGAAGSFITIFFPERLDKSKRDKPSEKSQDASAQEDQLRTSNDSSKHSQSDAIVWSRIKRTWRDIKLGWTFPQSMYPTLRSCSHY
jgi:hypothetical protein